MYKLSAEQQRIRELERELVAAPNLLDRQFNQICAASQVCMTDITRIPTDEGLLYLAAV